MVKILPSNPVSKLFDKLCVPPELSIIILLFVTPLYEVKTPVDNILSSPKTFTNLTTLLNPVPPELNVVSKVPSVFNLQILPQDIPLYEVKLPPTITFPLDCKSIE